MAAIYTMLINKFGNLTITICLHNYSTFSSNQVDRSEDEAIEIQDGSPQRAAISSFRFPLHFTGTNQLNDNTGGGLSTLGSVVKVDGTLFVHNNTASNGGGIHLEDHSLVRT